MTEKRQGRREPPLAGAVPLVSASGSRARTRETLYKYARARAYFGDLGKGLSFQRRRSRRFLFRHGVNTMAHENRTSLLSDSTRFAGLESVGDEGRRINRE